MRHIQLFDDDCYERFLWIATFVYFVHDDDDDEWVNGDAQVAEIPTFLHISLKSTLFCSHSVADIFFCDSWHLPQSCVLAGSVCSCFIHNIVGTTFTAFSRIKTVPHTTNKSELLRKQKTNDKRSKHSLTCAGTYFTPVRFIFGYFLFCCQVEIVWPTVCTCQFNVASLLLLGSSYIKVWPKMLRIDIWSLRKSPFLPVA